MKIVRLKKKKVEDIVITKTTRYIRVDGVTIPFPYDARCIFDKLNDVDGYFNKLEIYNTEFIVGMMKAGLIRNCNRGCAPDSIPFAGGKYAPTKKFTQNYKKLYKAVEDIFSN